AGGTADPHAVGAPLRPYARERHPDLSPSGRHPGGGGVAVAADRASLRLSPATPDWSNELTRLAGVHRWVVAGLALIFASGVLMMLAELDSVATSVVFWTKIGLIALLVVNGQVPLRAETELQPGRAARRRRFR